MLKDKMSKDKMSKDKNVEKMQKMSNAFWPLITAPRKY
jgi:hypothetical protein